MKKAIFYKEWIKTHRYFWLALIVSSVFVIYALLQLQRVIGFKGVEHLWEILLSRETVFIELLTYVPLAIGVLLALVQFVPEIQAEAAEIDAAPALSATEHDRLDARSRSRTARDYLRVELSDVVGLFAKHSGSRAGSAYPAHIVAVVPVRHYGLSLCGVDLPRTDLAPQDYRPADCGGRSADLFPFLCAGSVQLLFALARGVHGGGDAAAPTFGVPFQGGMPGLIRAGAAGL